MKIPPRLNEAAYAELDFQTRMIEQAVTAAATFDDFFGDAGKTPEAVQDVSPTGARFRIPLVAPFEHLSGDNRHFAEGALTHVPLPMPLLWQEKTAQGHDGSYIVGRIDGIEIDEVGARNAVGVFDVGPWAREAERLVRGGFLRHVSVDLDKFEGETPNPHYFNGEDHVNQSPTIRIDNKPIKINKARINAVTLVAKPAFQEAFMVLDSAPTLENGDDSVADGTYEETPMDIDSEEAALAASAAPLVPPSVWFGNPHLTQATPLTITDDGRVFGHIAAWSTSHIGLPRATKPPRSASNYAYFRTGALRTDDGTDVAVGQLTLAGGHAPLHASARDAVKHYDDTNSAVADVAAGEDQFGIWVAGALRPEVTPSQVRAFRASAPSGDWRPINGRLELVAVCAVNVPGFPIARTMVAGGQVTALVAAGASAIAVLKQDKVDQLATRLDAIEQAEFSAQAQEAAEAMAASFAAVAARREAEKSALVAAAEEARDLFFAHTKAVTSPFDIPADQDYEQASDEQPEEDPAQQYDPSAEGAPNDSDDASDEDDDDTGDGSDSGSFTDEAATEDDGAPADPSAFDDEDPLAQEDISASSFSIADLMDLRKAIYGE